MIRPVPKPKKKRRAKRSDHGLKFPKVVRHRDRALLDTFHDMKCLIFGCRYASDPAHLRGRGAFGADTKDNVANLCRIHHSQQGTIGHYRMSLIYPEYAKALDERGWTFGSRNNLIRKEVCVGKKI